MAGDVRRDRGDSRLRAAQFCASLPALVVESGKGHWPRHALAWQVAGWKTREVDLEAETLVFAHRNDQSDGDVAAGQPHVFSIAGILPPHDPGQWPEGLTVSLKVPIAGKQVHDANIVATMLTHDERRLLTFNTRDFRRYGDRIDLIDMEMAGGSYR